MRTDRHRDGGGHGCGDGLNDLDLIEGAGLGVAMGNAAEELKRAADFVTESNEDDGVVLAIRRCIFGM